MFANYFKTAWRNLLRHKTTSLLNILGLSVGMASCMLILIHIHDELSFNRFNTHLEDTYRINWISRDNSRVNVESSTPIPFSRSLQSDIPGIEYLAKLYQRNGEMEARENTVAAGEHGKRFQEKQVYFADRDLPDIFSISFISGDPQECLREPNTVVVTDEMASKYFGSEDPVGKYLLYDNATPLKITAIVSKMPENSDLRFDFLISFETIYHVESPGFADFIKNDWTFNPCDTWIRLKPGAEPGRIQSLLNEHLQRYGTERNHQMNSVSLQPLKDIHLYASQVIGNASSSDINYIYIFAAIALLILVIANVNFINLSVARSIDNIKEVGVRKVLGANKLQVVIQFLCNALATSFFAFIISCVLTALAIPLLNRLTGKQLNEFSWISPENIAVFILFFLVSGLAAGIYPAAFIARLKLTLALLGKSGDQSSRNTIQRILLVTQFTISVTLIISAAVIYQQLEYLSNKPLGFQKHQVLVVPIFGSGAYSFGHTVDTAMRRRMNVFSATLRNYSGVNDVTASSEMPGQGFVRGLIVPEGAREQDNIFTPWVSVDYNFMGTLHMQLVAGRDFSKSTGTDHLRAFVINESAVRAFGWKTPELAIGKNLVRGKVSDGKSGQVIGVVKDFNFNSLTSATEPLVMDVNPPRFTEFAINIQPAHLAQTIEQIQDTWDKIFPERVFEYSFLDKDIDGQYKDKENFSRLIGYFALCAILLSCSGLFSLSFFLAVKKAREISIRKVLGAGTGSIVLLLTGDFLVMIAISILLGAPIAWLLMHRWLQSFAYHVSVEWWIFILATLSVLVISFATICVQCLRAAMKNPVINLRSE